MGVESTAEATGGRQIDLSVVIPAFNESPRLQASLEKILLYLDRRQLRHEVLVVDDGSWDDTSLIARAFSSRGVKVLRRSLNGGKGAALKDGVERSRGRRVLLCDADLSAPIEQLESLEAHLGRAELVLGSRGARGARITRRQPLFRVALGRIFTLVVKLFGVSGVRDTQCGFKLLEGRAARSLFRALVTEGFAYDVELIWLARRSGYRVAEVGIEWADSPGSTVRPFTDSLWMLLELVRFRWHHRQVASRLAGSPHRSH